MGFALFLTFLAASTTILGGVFSLFLKKDNQKSIGFWLSFSAGVMLYISFMEILPKGLSHLKNSNPLIGLIAFLAGLLVIVFIDRLTPEVGHETSNINSSSLNKIGLLSLVMITVHNFPEGMAVFSVASESIDLSWPLVVAIGIHNFPEGIVIATPIFLATGNKIKAIGLTFLAAAMEPLGGIMGYLFLKNIFHNLTLGIVFCFVAGIMVFLSIDQILPEARKGTDHHTVSYGTITGMIFMALSLYLLS